MRSIPTADLIVAIVSTERYNRPVNVGLVTAALSLTIVPANRAIRELLLQLEHFRNSSLKRQSSSYNDCAVPDVSIPKHSARSRNSNDTFFTQDERRSQGTPSKKSLVVYGVARKSRAIHPGGTSVAWQNRNVGPDSPFPYCPLAPTRCSVHQDTTPVTPTGKLQSNAPHT